MIDFGELHYFESNEVKINNNKDLEQTKEIIYVCIQREKDYNQIRILEEL